VNSERIDSPLTRSGWGVVAACAASAGAHAALVPRHLEHEPRLGAAFIVATVVLAAVAFALIHRPISPLVAQIATLTLAAVIGAYAVNVSTGIPWLTNAAEHADVIGLATKAVEAVGLVFAIQLNTTKDGRRPPVQEEARP
jgi:hypothetical protein